MGRVAWVVAAWISVAVASGAAGQDLPDVVRLASGGMLRGTILEHDPASHVHVRLADGEERRIPIASVAWAGPAAEMPSLPRSDEPPAEAPRPPLSTSSAEVATPPGTTGAWWERGVRRPEAARREVAFRVRSDRDTLHLFVQTGFTDDWVGRRVSRDQVRIERDPRPLWGHVCRAPCVGRLSLSAHRLGISDRRDGHVRDLAPGVRIPDGSTLHVHWEDRQRVREVGGVLWVLGGTVGATGAVVGGYICGVSSCQGDAALVFGGGLALLTASFVAGILLTFLADDVSWRVEHEDEEAPERQ